MIGLAVTAPWAASGDQRADTDRRTGSVPARLRPPRSDRRAWDQSIAGGAVRAPL